MIASCPINGSLIHACQLAPMTVTRFTRYTILRLFRTHLAFAGRREHFRWAVIFLFLFHLACILAALLIGRLPL
jgi:hypothetical protein